MQLNEQIDTVLCSVRLDEGGLNIYHCGLCRMDYKDFPKFRIHMKSKHNYQAVICPKCPSMFEDRGQLMLHNNQTHLTVRVNCKSKLTEKKTANKKKLMLKCDLCNYETPNSGTLKTHIRGHTGEKPFACGVCEKGFTQKSNMLTHYRKHFEITNIGVFNCDDCNEFFANADCLQKHLASQIHKIMVVLNWVHEQKRRGEKYLQCRGCDEYSTGYAKELLSHASQCVCSPSARCMECNQFVELDMHILSEHMHQHQDNILCCWVCGDQCNSGSQKTFSNRHQLSIHMGLQHPGELGRSSVCIYCDKIFEDRDEMMEHVFDEHNEQRNKHISNENGGKLICEFEGKKCGFATNSLHMLDKHLRTEHGYLPNAEFGTQMLAPELLTKTKMGRPRIMSNLQNEAAPPPAPAATRRRKRKRNYEEAPVPKKRKGPKRLVDKIQKMLEEESD